MDFLFDLILELLFEVPIEAAMESKKLKTGVKTMIFCVIGGGVTLLFAALTVQKWLSGDDLTGTFFMTLITAAMLLGVIFGGICGHKKKWKTT